MKHNGDTDLRYQTTQALVEHHHIWIDHPMWTDSRVAQGRRNHLYAFYAPGQTAFMVPLYVAGKVIAHHLSLPYDTATLYASRTIDLWLGAALIFVFFLFASSIGYSVRSSAALAFLLGAGTVVWPDAQSALEQTQIELFLLIAAFAASQFVRGNLSSPRWLLLSGTSTGIAFFTRYDAILYVAIVAGYPTAIRLLRHQYQLLVRDCLWYGVGVLPWIAIVGLWNFARFGSPLSTGLHEATFWEPVWSGLANLTLSPGKGVLWYVPTIFLLPWAMRRLYRRVPDFAVFIAVLVLVTLLFYSNVLYWHGDPAWGPRYLFAVVPFLILPLGELFAVWQTRRFTTRFAVCALIGVSFAINFSAVAVSQWRYWYRVQTLEEHTSNPFRWGASYYHYYWNPAQSPILLQPDSLYQVVRLQALGVTRYALSARPTVCTLPIRCLSNPADDYPINTLSPWWADVRHPLLGAHTRYVLALLLALVALAAGLGLGRQLSASPVAATGERRAREAALAGEN